MQRIEGRAIEEIRSYFEEAARLANEATCLRAKCGSVIVATNGEIIGRGYNAPPQNDESQRQCEAEFDLTKKPKYDKTCCVHAEWNAVIDACKSAPEKLTGSTLYFMRVDVRAVLPMLVIHTARRVVDSRWRLAWQNLPCGMMAGQISIHW